MPSVLPSLLKLDHGMFKKDFDLSEEVRIHFVYCIPVQEKYLSGAVILKKKHVFRKAVTSGIYCTNRYNGTGTL